MNTRTANSSRAAFTLLELTIVLGILAIVTHLAIIEAVKFRSKNLRKTANAQLEEVQKAVLGQNLDCSSGFVADIGRPPCSRETESSARGSGVISYDASELWSRENKLDGSRLPAYTVLDAADMTNRASGSAAYDTMDRNIRVPCGWRGPYLRIPLGKDKLSDPWGNLFETPDASGASGRLLNGASNAVTKAGEDIAFLAHFGSDGIPDSIAVPAEAEEADFTVPLNVSTGSLDVCVEAYTAEGNSFPLPSGNSFTLRLYSPAIERVSGKNPAAKVLVQESQLLMATNSTLNAFSVTFPDVAPGPHTIAVKYSATAGIWTFEKVVAPLSDGSSVFHPVHLRLVVP